MPPSFSLVWLVIYLLTGGTIFPFRSALGGFEKLLRVAALGGKKVDQDVTSILFVGKVLLC